MKDDYFLTKQEISELRADAKKASELVRTLFKEATKFNNLEEKLKALKREIKNQ
jgi:hypothetical protein